VTVGGDDETVAGTTLQGVTAASALTQQLVAERYEIVRWLGGGGMGRVYEAHDRELGEKVALKVLNSGLSEEAIERFRREVRLTRRIQHRNIARMFDIGEHAGDRFLTMELVDGVSLAREVSSRPLAWSRLKTIAEQICAGLAAAHEAGVIHRDLKPDNILIERDTDRVVITDFGIARSLDDPTVTQVGAVLGTPRYMAPEQLAGRDVDTRADLFALGVMLFELATGTRPWSGDNAITIAVAMATTPPRAFVSQGVPASFEGIVAACLQLEPGDRPATARDIADAIARGGDVADRVLPPAPRPTSSTRATPVTHAAESTSLAVLPIGCLPADEYLADGIFEDLIDALSSTAGLRVRPAGIVRTRSPQDPRELGKNLEVDHVVTATLRRVPTGLRVSARLIGVADGFQIWAHKADCSEAEVLAMSDTLAHGIAAALSTRASVATRPTDPRAVDLYLRARAELRRFWGVHATAAADLLEQAAVFAPSSPAILGALAYASVLAWVMRGAPEMVDRARVALERGLASGHGEAYLASASWLLNHGDHERGAADLANALIRAPMSAPTHEMTGRILVEVGFPVEARRHFDTAIGLDPGRATIINADLARLDALEGNWTSADARVAALRHDPDEAIAQLGWVYETRLAGWRGNREAVLAAATHYVPKMGDNATSVMDLVASSIAGNVDTARWATIPEMYSGHDRPRRQQLLGLQMVSEMATVLGKHDVARDTLRQAVALGLIDTYWLGHCPLFVPFHDDSWFSEIRQGVADSASRVVTSFTAIAAL